MGSGTRSSTSPQSTKNASESRPSPTTAGDVQPQFSPSVSPIMSAISAPESSSAPGTSTRDGVRIGDSGT